jgi:hypothetical protein
VVVERASRAEDNSSKDEKYRGETFEAKAEESQFRRWERVSYARRGEEACESGFRQEAGGVEGPAQGCEKRNRRQSGVRRAGARERGGSKVGVGESRDAGGSNRP